ncbi:MAG TPA: four-carbon acid sugar kinase family protein [Bacillota bacterium]|nr:four-carbon acid sugar kinase family protein [Bacillota bacterium]HOA15786.1 four-carbon acid sugar kinase family protein [Bacillota bacterium]HOG53216.1 four-carbon acid sugar kinase family protein [Bacillota bacterium]
MPRMAVIADDLTGGNATGILFGKRGFKAITFLGDTAAELPDGADVIVVSTESRALARQEAYSRVYKAAKDLMASGVTHFEKRIDSTLRGNLGAEIDALLDALRSTGKDPAAIVAPAFPTSGRATIGGYHMVNGVPLELTGVSKDPTSPVRDSSLPRILSQQSGNKVGSLPLETVIKGSQAVSEALKALYSDGVRIVAADSVSDEDLEKLAKGTALSGIPVVSCDPGPFGAALAAALFPKEKNEPSPSKVIVVAGSVTAQTRKQLEQLGQGMKCHFVRVDAGKLALGGGQAEGEAVKAISHMRQADADTKVICFHTISADADILDIGELAGKLGTDQAVLTERIADGLAGIGVEALADLRGGKVGVYGTGGDVIAAICRACGASGIELVEEVMPLATYGRLVGGPNAGLDIVTKGGMVGDADAALACVRHLFRRMEEK